MRTITLLNILSLAVSAVVTVSSYLIATRLITELRHELAMLRALGVKKPPPFTLILAYITTISLT